MSDLQLKPCPFCGGEGILKCTSVIKASYVRCKLCSAETAEVEISPEYSSNEKAAELWNSRDGVRPERHGQWSKTMVSAKEKAPGYHNNDVRFGFQCSECGAVLSKTNFCGNCGAQMDRKDDENND